MADAAGSGTRARPRAARSGMRRRAQGKHADDHDRPRRARAASSELQVGLVGALGLDVAGAAAVHGTLARVAGLPLVLVSSDAAGPAAVARAARAHPASHFALVGASTKGHRAGNLVGLVLRDEQAAQLAGTRRGLRHRRRGGDRTAGRVGGTAGAHPLRRVRARRPSRAAGSHRSRRVVAVDPGSLQGGCPCGHRPGRHGRRRRPWALRAGGGGRCAPAERAGAPARRLRVRQRRSRT